MQNPQLLQMKFCLPITGSIIGGHELNKMNHSSFPRKLCTLSFYKNKTLKLDFQKNVFQDTHFKLNDSNCTFLCGSLHLDIISSVFSNLNTLSVFRLWKDFLRILVSLWSRNSMPLKLSSKLDKKKPFKTIGIYCTVG